MTGVKPSIKLTKHSSTKHDEVDFKQLPSYQYRHVNWSDLKEMKITGPQLKGPRVRATPTLKDSEFDNVPETSANYQPHIYNFSSQQEKRTANREVKEVRSLKKKVENWEDVLKVNLSYQELGGKFQSAMLASTFKKMFRCQQLILVDNRLSDLCEFTFACLEELNLSLNIFDSFAKLPKCPNLRILNMTGNKINKISDIIGYPKLEILMLRNNPLVWTIADYRKLIFQKIPSLLSIDGVTRDDLTRREKKNGLDQ